MERRANTYIETAERLARQKGGIESLKGAIENTERLLKNGEPVGRNLGILEKLLQLARRAGKNADQN